MDNAEFIELAGGDTVLSDAAVATHRQIRMALHMVMGTPMLKDLSPDAVVAIAQIIATNAAAGRSSSH